MRFWVERHRSRAALGFQSLNDRSICPALSSFAIVRRAVAARRERELRRIVEGTAVDAGANRRHCPPPFRFPYRASSSFCCGSPRTNDDARHPKRFHLVLRPAKAASAPRPHVCSHRSPQLRSCLRCCSKRALLLDRPPRILEFLRAESSLKTVAVLD